MALAVMGAVEAKVVAALIARVLLPLAVPSRTLPDAVKVPATLTAALAVTAAFAVTVAVEAKVVAAYTVRL